MASPDSQMVTALALEAQPSMISVPFSGWINLLNGLAMTNDKSLPEPAFCFNKLRGMIPMPPPE